jgi:hypothetical protein
MPDANPGGITASPESLSLRSPIPQGFYFRRAPMLTLPRPLSLTPAQFAQACAAKPEAVLELDTDGMLIEEPPACDTSSARNPRL